MKTTKTSGMIVIVPVEILIANVLNTCQGHHYMIQIVRWEKYNFRPPEREQFPGNSDIYVTVGMVVIHVNSYAQLFHDKFPLSSKGIFVASGT